MADQPTKQPFYNVMPEIAGAGKPPVVKPSLAPKPAVNAAPLKGSPNTSSKSISLPTEAKDPGKRKFLLIGAIVFAVILLGSGSGYYFFSLKSDEPKTEELNSNDGIEQINPDVTTPGEWLQRYFGAETCTELVTCGDKSDPDRDGLDNKAEFDTGTDPNNNDSDKDGIADGDEALIFSSDPLLSKTYRNGDYQDADFVKGGYDVQTNEPYTNERLVTIKTAIKQYGLHQPTLTTLGSLSFQLYEFTDPSLPALPADLDVSPQAKLDRDSQRQATIKKIGAALLKYQFDKKSFPPTDDFIVMSDMIKTYNTVATNYNDPVARDPYVYGYSATNKNSEFILTYYSETQNQLIKYFTKDAQADAAKDTSKVSDQQRKTDLENIQQALLVYSSTQLDPSSDKEFIFPPVDKLKSSLVPRYLTSIPTDPVTKLEYQYQVGAQFDTFTIKATLQNPSTGTTGYLCNQDECKPY